jgi:RNA polymerase sigma factor (sigma-70 family)
VAADDRTAVSGAKGKLEGVNPADIGAFYQREMPRLVLFVKTLSSSLDGHAAADVAQTAFERALPRWPALRSPKAWLYKVAQHEAFARCEALRREMLAEAVPDQPDRMSAALAAELRQEQRDVMAHLQALAPKQRQVMIWTLAGFSDAEIAEALDLSTDAVKSNRRYARRNLSKQLGLGRRGTR